jgi:hypothetical protein
MLYKTHVYDIGTSKLTPFRRDRRPSLWKGGHIELKPEPDSRAILAAWVREIVQAQPASFRVLPEEDRKAILEREIARRLYAECDANPDLHRAFCEFLRLRKRRN